MRVRKSHAENSPPNCAERPTKDLFSEPRRQEFLLRSRSLQRTSSQPALHTLSPNTMPSIHFSAQLTDETCLDIIEFYALDGLKQEIKNWQRERQPELVRLYMRGRPISVIHREIFPEIPEHVLRMHLGWLGFPKSKERDLFIAETYAILQGQACLKCKKDRVECDWGKPACKSASYTTSYLLT